MAEPTKLETEAEQAALVSLGLAGTYKFFQSVGLHSVANPLPGLVAHGSGVRVTPGGVIPRPTPAIVTWAAPQPIGLTPPHYFGLERDWLAGVDWLDLMEHGPEQGAEQSRQLAVAQAAAAQLNRIAERSRELNDAQVTAALAVVGQLDQLRTQSKNLADRIDITHAASVLESERNVRVDLRARGLDVLGNPLPVVARLQPPAPGNDAAVAQRLQANNPPDP